MVPSLVAVGTYSLLLAWNEYLYAFLLLSKDTDIALIPASVFRCAANAFKAADTPSLFCPFKRNAKA